MKLNIRECTIGDMDTLHDLSCQTFYDAFSSMNTPANMRAYLETAFSC